MRQLWSLALGIILVAVLCGCSNRPPTTVFAGGTWRFLLFSDESEGLKVHIKVLSVMFQIFVLYLDQWDHVTLGIGGIFAFKCEMNILSLNSRSWVEISPHPPPALNSLPQFCWIWTSNPSITLTPSSPVLAPNLVSSILWLRQAELKANTTLMLLMTTDRAVVSPKQTGLLLHVQ